MATVLLLLLGAAAAQAAWIFRHHVPVKMGGKSLGGEAVVFQAQAVTFNGDGEVTW